MGVTGRTCRNRAGGLVLDTRQGIRARGSRGPAVVPGNVESSVLIKAIRYTDKDFANAAIGEAGGFGGEGLGVVELRMGAAFDTRDGSAVVKTYDTEAAKKWGAFQPVKRPDAAKVADTAWPRGEIDKYVLAGLEAKNIKPVADAGQGDADPAVVV